MYINTALGTGVENNYSNYGFNFKFRDVTEEVNRALLPYIRLGQSFAAIPSNLLIYEPYRYGTFALLVNHGSIWDIKRKGPWESTIGTSFPGYGALIVYQGMIVTPENLGNYTYGLLGAAFGIPLDFLLDGSSFAAFIGGSLYSWADVDNEVKDWYYISLGYMGYYL